QTAPGNLTVTATSSNPSLLPQAGIVLGGIGADRTVALTPAAGQTGTATVTLTVRDAAGATALDTFVMTVPDPNNTAPTISNVAGPTTAPTITDVADLTVPANAASAALPFTVGDAQTAAGNLVVSASSSNTNVLPLSGIALGGTGASRTVTVAPAAGKTGTAT